MPRAAHRRSRCPQGCAAEASLRRLVRTQSSAVPQVPPCAPALGPLPALAQLPRPQPASGPAHSAAPSSQPASGTPGPALSPAHGPLPHGMTRGRISAGLPALSPASRPAPCPPGPARTSCPLLARPPLLPATAASASATPTAPVTPTPQAALRQRKTTTGLREYRADAT